MKASTTGHAPLSHKVTTERSIAFWGLWAVLFAMCGLFALAIKDYERDDKDRQLERAHNAGMRQGYELCKSEGRR
jgi:hypothetical protein